MDCLNCDNEALTDYGLCATCAITCHFTNRDDCKCEDCESDDIIYPVWFDLASYEPVISEI